MIEKYVKRPVIMEAVQYTGKNVMEIISFVGLRHIRVKYVDKFDSSKGAEITIITFEGDHYVSVNDYIIKGIKGEFYPCKPDIFEQIYERVN